MSVTYGFYNSQNSDRRYDAIQMSSIFDGIIEDGVLQHVGTAMMVEAPGDSMTVNVGIGRAWFKHTWTLNDAILPLEISGSDVLLDRIDAVVIEVDARVDYRQNSIKVVKGTAAENPSNPTMLDEDERWQFPLAYVRVNAGATYIRQSNVTNMVGTSSCPFVTAPLEKMDIDALIAQWGDQWQEFYENETADMEETNAYWKELWAEWFEQQTDEMVATNEYWKKQWETWFEAQANQIQDAYLAWELQWNEWYSAQVADMEATTNHWKEAWKEWFSTYISIYTQDITDTKTKLTKEVEDWLAALEVIIDDDTAASLANQMLKLEEKFQRYDDFMHDLAIDHVAYHPLEDNNYNVYDSLLDSDGDEILSSDWSGSEELFDSEDDNVLDYVGDKVLANAKGYETIYTEAYGNDALLDSDGDQIFGRFIYVIK